ncbi:MAG TPA: DUF3313 family protein [Allosphingosinicella sp.]
MNKLTLSIVLAAMAVAPLAAQEESALEGLVKVQGARLDAAYLMPGVDFRSYTKVMLDPTEVAFRRNWQRNYNSGTRTGRITNSDMTAAAERVRTGFEEIFAEAYRRAGYEVVTQPGPDVLRLRTGVFDLFVNAPDQMTAGRSRTYSVEAGEATLVLEARDSETRALLGRAFDRRTAGDNTVGMRTSVSNQADFEQLFHQWAQLSVRSMEELKARSPITDPATARQRR